jgi:hypothetical protein
VHDASLVRELATSRVPVDYDAVHLSEPARHRGSANPKAAARDKTERSLKGPEMKAAFVSTVFTVRQSSARRSMAMTGQLYPDVEHVATNGTLADSTKTRVFQCA